MKGCWRGIDNGILMRCVQMKNQILKEAKLPGDYNNYVFDLYGTLVDVRSPEDNPRIWEKVSLFMGYYGAIYEPKELEEAYHLLVEGRESKMRESQGRTCSFEVSPEIEIVDVFTELYSLKGVRADETLAIHTGQFFRVETIERLQLYEGTKEMLEELRNRGKRIWLLSNAQRIFTIHELNYLDLERYFNGILISSDYQVKKPDRRFFHLLKEKFGVGKKGTLFIGNESVCDIEGARGIELDTYYVHSEISSAGDAKLLEEGKIPANYIVENFKKWEGVS